LWFLSVPPVALDRSVKEAADRDGVPDYAPTMLGIDGPAQIAEDVSSQIPVWVPLLGVIVGAVLAGASQVLTGRVQRHHERERDNREERRRAHTEFLHALGNYQIALIVTRNRLSWPSLDSDTLERLPSAMHRFNAALATLEINGSPNVCQLAGKIKTEVTSSSLEDKDSQDKMLNVEGALESELISAIRRDLGIVDH
jgi:hypothetical protein